MKIVENYISYLLSSILEASGNKELPLIFSDRFKDLIVKIAGMNNEIAKRLLWSEGINSKKIYIDLDDDNVENITFLISNKVIDILGRNDGLLSLGGNDLDKVYNSKQRATQKVNKFINDLYNKEYSSESITKEKRKELKDKGIKTPPEVLEEFFNMFVSLRKPGEFKLVKGEDVRKFYHQDTYQFLEGTLENSCMREEKCQEFMDFYVDNPDCVGLLILKSNIDDEKIMGRALVWELDIPSGRTFMDRIYTINEYDVQNFKNYAIEKGWLFKEKQNMYAETSIVDDDTIEQMVLVVKGMDQPDDELNPLYPYLDTLKYYNPTNSIISNNMEYIKDIAGGTPIYNLEGIGGDDYGMSGGVSYEELVENYKDEILSDIEYYVTHIYPGKFWDHINDDAYIENYIEGEYNYVLEDFKYIFDTEEEKLIDYIKENTDSEDDLPEGLDEMGVDDLSEYMADHNLKEGFVSEYLKERYYGYSAEDVMEELYGGGVDENIYNILQYYFDEDAFAEDVANSLDEDYLREYFDER